MYLTEGLFSDKTLKAFHAERELLGGEPPLAAERALTKPGKILRFRILRAVDYSKILPAAHFDGRLDEPLALRGYELRRLYHHPLAASSRVLCPPISRFSLRRFVQQVYWTGSCLHQEIAVFGE